MIKRNLASLIGAGLLSLPASHCRCGDLEDRSEQQIRDSTNEKEDTGDSTIKLYETESRLNNPVEISFDTETHMPDHLKQAYYYDVNNAAEIAAAALRSLTLIEGDGTQLSFSLPRNKQKIGKFTVAIHGSYSYDDDYYKKPMTMIIIKKN